MATRPTTTPAAFATAGGARVTPSSGYSAQGHLFGKPVPDGIENYLEGWCIDWVRYLAELSPASDQFTFREWECPDDSSYGIAWSAASSPSTDGVLTLTTKTATIALGGSGAVLAIGGTGSGGTRLTDGVRGYGFGYDPTTGTVTSGSPPVMLDIYAPAAGASFSVASMTVNRFPGGKASFQGNAAGTASTGVILLPYAGMGKGSEATVGDTTTYLHEVGLWVTAHDESGGGSPNTTVSIESMDREGVWTVRATATLVNIIASGTSVPLAPVASSVREIPRGAPLRLVVEHAAITGETQFIEIQSVSLYYLRDAVD